MKWLIRFLVLANVALFAWQYRHLEPHGTANIPAEQANLPSLVLVSEAKQQAPAAQPPQQAQVAVGAAPEPAAPQHRAEGFSKPPAVGAVEHALPATPVTTVASAAVEPEAQPEEVAPRQILRDDEMAALKIPRPEPPVTPALEPSPAVVPVSEEPPSLVQSCFLVGPITDENITAGVADSLERREAEVRIRSETEREPWRYWVYLPRFASTEEARNMLAKLKEAGIKDYLRVTSGDNENTISLGVYSKPASAKRRVAYMIRRGFDANYETRYRESVRYWLEVRWQQLDEITEMGITDLPEETRVEPSACTRLASFQP